MTPSGIKARGPFPPRSPTRPATLAVMRTRVFLPLLLLVVVPLAALSATPAAGQNGTALLTDVQAQNMGDFDRVTFTFEGGVPEILQADYFDGPAAEQPSGLLVFPPVAGPPRLQITMSNASGFDLSVDPVRPRLHGPEALQSQPPEGGRARAGPGLRSDAHLGLRAPGRRGPGDRPRHQQPDPSRRRHPARRRDRHRGALVHRLIVS